MHPLSTVKGAVTAGVALAVVIGMGLALWAGNAPTVHPMLLDRWLHLLAGIVWLGLLYYFNFVQMPGLAAAASDKGGPGGAGIGKYIAPRALLWFRWAAVVTWLTGAIYLMNGYGAGNHGAILGALTLQPGYRSIGVGAWLGTIMLFNVWVFIWPNQKKILGLSPATDEEMAAARKLAARVSRINVILSLPMVMCMGGQAHGLPF